MSETENQIRIWIAAYTAPNAEVAVRDAVTGLGYPVLLPTALTEMTHARKVMHVVRPVFPRYVFIGIPHGKSWYPVVALPGVGGVLSGGNKPKELPPKQISLLKAAMDADGFSQSPAPQFREGQAVTVKIGQTTVAAFVGKINSALPAQRIDVLFSMFGKEHKRAVPLDQIRAA